MRSQRPNFDPIARPYRWLEYLSFGPFLDRCRYHYLNRLSDCRRALIVGDGDGRFTARLLASNGEICVDAIDSSSRMLELLQVRASRLGPSAEKRLRTWNVDARALNPESFSPRVPSYDLIATHFFLDCLNEDEISALIERIQPHLVPGATWLVSEFSIPDRQPSALLFRAIVVSLYRVFGLLTGLQVGSLPDYAASLRRHGFSRHEHKDHLGGLLISETWSFDRNFQVNLD